MTDFPTLLSPIQAGTTVLRNRVIMGSMHLGLEDRPEDFPRLAAFYRERVRGGVGLVVTGGYAPSRSGRLSAGAAKLTTRAEMLPHHRLTGAVHEEGGKIILQILHAGRYADHQWSVAPSAIRSPITRHAPTALTSAGVEAEIAQFVRCAALAAEAGYDGVEIMGSEGYLINEFLAPCTNLRDDEWGGGTGDRQRLAIEIVRRTRQAIGADFLILYRISLMDLVPGGQTWDDVTRLAKAIEQAGASALNSGIGWHEARVPTVAASVPRAAFATTTAKIAEVVGIPVAAANRINTPEVAERILAAGGAQLVSLARPFLADPEWVGKAATGRAAEINTCIGCNQACLDHAFAGREVSCLVNPRAGFETELPLTPARAVKRVAVVGAGPAGLSATLNLARRGHHVELFEAHEVIGGQFELARRIPGKEEFNETLRYFAHQLELNGVLLHLGRRVAAEDLIARRFDEVVLATGVTPRVPDIPGIDHRKVLLYPEALNNARTLGHRVAVIGAGGIGVDVATFLSSPESTALGPGRWRAEWGVGDPELHRSGLREPVHPPSPRVVYLLQRKPGRVGTSLAKSSGWIHRAKLAAGGVMQKTAVNYEWIDGAGLHISSGPDRRHPEVLDVDHIVICAGQLPVRDLERELTANGTPIHVIGGADVAAELDAKRAIRQGTVLAMTV